MYTTTERSYQDMIEVHTLDISHTITEWEAKRLKEKYQIKKQEVITKIGIKGINQIQIKENYIPKNKTHTARTRYHLHIQVNLGKLLSISNIKMAAINEHNRKKMETLLHKIMEKEWILLSKNCNVQDWTLNRLDYGKDITFQGKNPNAMVSIYLRLLNHALNLYNNRNCKRIPYLGSNNVNAVYESIYFGNQAYIYNIYNKLDQLSKKYTTLTPEQQAEAQGLLRIEKQMRGKSLAALGTPQKVSLLFNDTIIEKLFSTLIKELKLFFGTGDFLFFPRAVNVIIQSKHSLSRKQQLRDMMSAISHYGFYQAVQKEMQKEIHKNDTINLFLQGRKDLEKLGISASCISEIEVKEIGVTTLPELSKLLGHSHVQKPVKRKKGAFGKIIPDKKNCRYRCNFSVHDAQGKRFRLSLADKDKENLKKKILYKMIDIHQKNLQQAQGNPTETLSIIQQTVKDLSNFKTTIEEPEILKWIDYALNKIYEQKKTVTRELNHQV